MDVSSMTDTRVDSEGNRFTLQVVGRSEDWDANTGKGIYWVYLDRSTGADKIIEAWAFNKEAATMLALSACNGYWKHKKTIGVR